MNETKHTCPFCGDTGCSECLAPNDQDAIDWEADKQIDDI